MVSTRHHPEEFPAPGTASTPSATAARSRSSSPGPGSRKWVHTPSTAMTLWLVVSVPLVLWDAGYVLLRPHSMPGGRLHSPLWTPYALYGTVDYIYGWPAFNARNGFTAAQTVMNLVETAAYLFYLYVVYEHGTSTTPAGRASQRRGPKGLMWFLRGEKVVPGRIGALALLVAYSASVMTVSKTLLYWLNEVYSGFENIGHNSLATLVPYWIIPNGLWIIFPGYNIYLLGREILTALENVAPRAGHGRTKST
ncbi:hypothetical protein VTN02DRAFT_1351 [Thermoascus thermophilus]